MTDAAPTEADVARRIVEGEVGEQVTTERVAAAGQQVCVRLYRHLGRWVGIDGCAVLIDRALHEVSATRPWLDDVRSRARTLPHLDHLETSLQGRPAPEGMEAIVSLLTVFIQLLGAAIGLDLAQRLVQDAWLDEVRRPPTRESKRHDW